ncbi:MAG: hypothetical protein A3G49_02370 [Candidatus Sungbacteria bacterium RIFCSPLOWO2_12_FULL_41_11]|uniref:Polymerase beta nucleotidyltransferase domain-containing protein n=1 Tax=Candidatus Sungbacteria bacterium RIFCSPLOWO2_12_FULL_41_11 TaxID=1802286 RepID=A0A1G2LNK1_9BACT|nr:MAG: polymerase beta domain protein region protein [Parcubacteria group bacterium GW2011_GWA2_42_14]OGZ98130.1 MAG: hypothetical protein A3D41_04070 [Candidatus Sungbacteria bacterium RIFCSPHIGHO2_02_FULL_41_12b]OHA13186.1 MAG: hypothetical protein A3G49_02370 [Candidatus Sungbacteria bacterium RIFCSPLOWO2_12_FULL_41_11]
MRLEHYPVEKLKKEILESIGRHLDLSQYRVFFFGSRVAGKGTDRSDIDVGIEGKEPVPFIILEDIKEDFEKIPTLYKIDIVDFCRVAPKFRVVALQKVESL